MTPHPDRFSAACRWSAALGVAILVSGTSAHAYRPFATEDATVAAARSLELELSWDSLRHRRRRWEHAALLVPTAGLPGGVELSGEFRLVVTDPPGSPARAGAGDTRFRLKWAAPAEPGLRPALAIAGSVQLPTGNADRGLGSGHTDADVLLAATWRRGRCTAHGMAAYAFAGGSDRDTLSWGVAGDCAAGSLRLAAELVATHVAEPATAGNDLQLLGGLLWPIGPSLVADAALRWGVLDGGPDWSATVGISVILATRAW